MPISLFDLPAELRLCVYEYVFGDNNDEEIDFFAAVRYHPSTAILATCRQIHDESQPFHAAASELYRSTKTFTIMLDPKLIPSSYLIARIKSYGEPHAKFPLCVRKLRFGFLGSSASLLFSVDDSSDKLHLLERSGSIGDGASLRTWLLKGNIPTPICECINNDYEHPYVISRGNNDMRMMHTAPIIAIVLSNCIHVRGRDNAVREEIMEAVLDVAFSKGWFRLMKKVEEEEKMREKVEEEKKMKKKNFFDVKELSLLRRADRVEKLQKFKNWRNKNGTQRS